MGDSRSSERDSLWEFALALYSSPGIEETALFLQDTHGLRVSILLWAAWLQVRKLKLDSAGLTRAEALIAPWEDGVLVRIRALRRRLKPLALRNAHVAELRSMIKECELQAERLGFDRLAVLPVTDSGALTPAENCRLYMAAHGIFLQQDTTLAKRLLQLDSFARLAWLQTKTQLHR